MKYVKVQKTRNMLLSVISLTLLASLFTDVTLAKKNDELQTRSYLVSYYGNVSGEMQKKAKRHYKYDSLVSVDLTDQEVQELRSDPSVEYIEEDHVVRAAGETVPSGVSQVQAIDAHALGATGEGIKVAVADTGIDWTHEDLNISGGASFVNGISSYRDDHGHGTHVAGTIAALDNEVGSIGVAPKVSLYSLKVLNSNASGDISSLISAVEWAMSQKINILNMSLEFYTHSKSLERVLNKALSSGMLLIAAAGNRGTNTIAYPAAYQSVIAVGSVDALNRHVTTSNTGSDLEFVAPGENVWSTYPGGYQYSSGTSMAAPHVTGVAALVWQSKRTLTNEQLRALLQASSTPIGDKNTFGYGLVNAVNAITR